MLQIRENQMDALMAAQRKRLVGDILAHVMAVFAPLVALTGETRARLAIEGALDRAAPYGISADAHLCEFVNLAFVFGDAFPYAPEFAWARRILDQYGLSVHDKLQRLRSRALEILSERALAEMNAT